jgi:uncharacterized protein involved in response to NO
MPISPSLAATRSRTDAGWFFAVSFRPFFAGASALAAMSVPAWTWMYLTGGPDVAGLPAMAWHAHEMVFGFLPAVMAGYLLTATPNWSGRLPASGLPLAVLWSVWLAGRVVPFVATTPWAAAVDVAFPLAMTGVLLREARARSQRQSRHGLVLFPVLAVASLAHRLIGPDGDLAAIPARLGIAVAVLLMSAVGGRLVPSLTRNTLAGRDAEQVPEPYGRYDVVVLAVAFPALVAWVVAPTHWLSAAAMALAAVLQAIRLARWRGWLVRRIDVAALHLGYLWVVLGTAAVAVASDPVGLVPPDVALHAFTAGAVGTMTMAVMARLSTSRGTGLRGSTRLCAVALVLVTLGAVARVGAPLVTGSTVDLLVAGATLWTAAWVTAFAAQISPAFLRRGVRGS